MTIFPPHVTLYYCSRNSVVEEAKKAVTSLSRVHLCKVKFSLEQAMNAQRGSRGIALLFFNLGARWGWVVNATPRPLYPRE
jgi:catalase